MSGQENTEIVREAYRNFQTGDIESLLNKLADDVAWQLPSMENVPFAGKYQGREDVGRFFATLNEAQEAREFEPQNFIADGDKVAVQGRYLWRVKAGGREYQGDWMHVFTLRDGKITGFQEYTDTAAAASAYQKALSA
jgi:Ketosteroid isomerase-related protein